MNIHTYLVLVALLNHTEGQIGFLDILDTQTSDERMSTLKNTNRPMRNSVVSFANVYTTNIVHDFIAFYIGKYPIPNKDMKYNVYNDFIAEYETGLTNEDIILTGAELILKYGYELHIYTVETDDAYLLTLYRIPGLGRQTVNESVVFLMHDILGSSDDFIIAGPESGLAYLLAREGYDVWMGNARGNKHSRAHKTLSPSQKKFWNFSWHEIGVYDLPAMIDYVLKETKKQTLKYIGYSQGTTSFFVMASELPEYNDKISIMVALSPVAFTTHIKSPVIRLITPTSLFIDSALRNLEAYEFIPDNLLIKNLKKASCGLDEAAEILCSNAVFLMMGFDVAQLNATNLPVVFGHMPSGASTKQFTHYSQGKISDRFAKFDDHFCKSKHYLDTGFLPQYNLTLIRAPVALFYSDDDWMAHPKDVERLKKELPNVVESYKVPCDHFTHLDFIIAKDFKTLIYDKLRVVLKTLIT